jgi:hypothetical protein
MHASLQVTTELSAFVMTRLTAWKERALARRSTAPIKKQRTFMNRVKGVGKDGRGSGFSSRMTAAASHRLTSWKGRDDRTTQAAAAEDTKSQQGVAVGVQMNRRGSVQVNPAVSLKMAQVKKEKSRAGKGAPYRHSNSTVLCLRARDMRTAPAFTTVKDMRTPALASEQERRR